MSLFRLVIGTDVARWPNGVAIKVDVVPDTDPGADGRRSSLEMEDSVGGIDEHGVGDDIVGPMGISARQYVVGGGDASGPAAVSVPGVIEIQIRPAGPIQVRDVITYEHVCRNRARSVLQQWLGIEVEGHPHCGKIVSCVPPEAIAGSVNRIVLEAVVIRNAAEGVVPIFVNVVAAS